jgi:hypothetical protein
VQVPRRGRERSRGSTKQRSGPATPSRRLRSRRVKQHDATPRNNGAENIFELDDLSKPRFFNSNFRQGEVQQLNIGQQTLECLYCHARMWKEERLLSSWRSYYREYCDGMDLIPIKVC